MWQPRHQIQLALHKAQGFLRRREELEDTQSAFATVSANSTTFFARRALTQVPNHQPRQMPQEARARNQRRHGQQDPDRRSPRGNAVGTDLERGVCAIRLHRLYPEQEEHPYAVIPPSASVMPPLLLPSVCDVPRPHNRRVPPQHDLFNEEVDKRGQRRKRYPIPVSTPRQSLEPERETHAQKTTPAPSTSHAPTQTFPAAEPAPRRSWPRGRS